MNPTRILGICTFVLSVQQRKGVRDTAPLRQPVLTARATKGCARVGIRTQRTCFDIVTFVLNIKPERVSPPARASAPFIRTSLAVPWSLLAFSPQHPFPYHDASSNTRGIFPNVRHRFFVDLWKIIVITYITLSDVLYYFILFYIILLSAFILNNKNCKRY